MPVTFGLYQTVFYVTAVTVLEELCICVFTNQKANKNYE